MKNGNFGESVAGQPLPSGDFDEGEVDLVFWPAPFAADGVLENQAASGASLDQVARSYVPTAARARRSDSSLKRPNTGKQACTSVVGASALPHAGNVTLRSEVALLEPSWTPSSSSYTLTISKHNEREQELLQLLAATRKQVKLAQRTSRTSGTAEWKAKTVEANALLQQLAAQLGQLVEEHHQLQRNCRMVNMHIELLEREHRCMQPVPLVSQARLLASTDLRPAASGAVVSVLELPLPEHWNHIWDERVRDLATGDLLSLHRQWLQHSALLLPKVQMLPRHTPVGLEAQQQLEELLAKYDYFTQRIMKLAPGAWQDMVNFDLESHSLLPEAPTNAYMQRFWQTSFPDEAKTIFPVRMHYVKCLKKLQEEQSQLQQAHAELCAGDGRGSGGGPADEAASSSWVRRDQDVEVDRVLGLLQRNLKQQEVHKAACYHGINYSLAVEKLIQIKLVLYPLALNGQVLID